MFDLTALVAVLVVLVAGGLLKDPPRHWWPADIDAQAWAIDRKLNRSIPHNAPAVRHYRPGEAMRTGALPLMWLTAGNQYCAVAVRDRLRGELRA